MRTCGCTSRSRAWSYTHLYLSLPCLDAPVPYLLTTLALYTQPIVHGRRASGLRPLVTGSDLEVPYHSVQYSLDLHVRAVTDSNDVMGMGQGMNDVSVEMVSWIDGGYSSGIAPSPNPGHSFLAWIQKVDLVLLEAYDDTGWKKFFSAWPDFLTLPQLGTDQLEVVVYISSRQCTAL